MTKQDRERVERLRQDLKEVIQPEEILIFLLGIIDKQGKVVEAANEVILSNTFAERRELNNALKELEGEK